MLPTILFCLIVSFVMTTMLAQLFPDGRFPLATMLLVMVLAAGGAWVGNRYLNGSFVTGALLGAGLTATGVLFLLHRTGILVAEPTPANAEAPPEQERPEAHP